MRFITVLLLLTLSCALALLNFSPNVATLKSQLLTLSRTVDRGVKESPDQRAEIFRLFEALEKKNPTKGPLASPLINAVWSLEYTTSQSIRGDKNSPRIGPILQTVDARNLRGQNSETVRYLGLLEVDRKVTFELQVLSPSKALVTFKRFTVGPFSFNAPATAQQSLETTYLDKDLRLARGGRGNIFVLTKFSDLP